MTSPIKVEPSKRDYEKAREIFKACVLTNFCGCGCPSHKNLSVPGSVVDAVATALAEQRERDARIAESMKEYRKSVEPQFMFGEAYACEDIAAAIRQGENRHE